MTHQGAQPLPPDLFVLVRPPPSSSRSLLDLQIQLLVPSAARAPLPTSSIPPPPPARRASPSSTSSSVGGIHASTTSFDAIAGARVTGTSAANGDIRGPPRASSGAATSSDSQSQLSRSPSLGSTRSARSVSTSASGTSESGYTSAGTSASGRRKVTPLLNLEYHTVLPTVVTDAGTDQRVARFLKRGIELTGFAVFDPLDLATAASLAASSAPISPVPSNQGSTVASTSTAPPPPVPATSGNGSGGFFGRFKRLGINQNAASPNPAAKVLSTLTAGSGSSSSSDGPSPYALPLLRTRSSLTSSPSAALRPVDAYYPHPHGAAYSFSSERGYSFQVRKWIRSEFVDAPKSGLRLEWVRAKRRRRKTTNRRGREADAESEDAQVRAGSRTSRASSVSARSVNDLPSPTASDASAPVLGAVDDGSTRRSSGDGDEDHDEDEEEERAWICSLVYPMSTPLMPRPSGEGSSSAPASARPSTSSRMTTGSPPLSSASYGANASSSSLNGPHTTMTSTTLRRMHLATLQPAPHHPKLVSTLLLPPTLPSIPIGGSYSPQRGFSGGGVLGPEDLRDLAMCTAMWVAVREGLGALEGVVEQLVGAADPNSTAVPLMADAQTGHGSLSATTSRAENRKSMESTRTSASVAHPGGGGSAPSSSTGGSPTNGDPTTGSFSRGSRLGPGSINGGNNGKKAGGGPAGSSGLSNAASRVSILFGGGGSGGRSTGPGGPGGGGGEKGNGGGTSLGLRERWIAATAK